MYFPFHIFIILIYSFSCFSEQIIYFVGFFKKDTELYGWRFNKHITAIFFFPIYAILYFHGYFGCRYSDVISHDEYVRCPIQTLEPMLFCL